MIDKTEVINLLPYLGSVTTGEKLFVHKPIKSYQAEITSNPLTIDVEYHHLVKLSMTIGTTFYAPHPSEDGDKFYELEKINREKILYHLYNPFVEMLLKARKAASEEYAGNTLKILNDILEATRGK